VENKPIPWYKKSRFIVIILLLSLIANLILFFYLASSNSENKYSSLEKKYPLISKRVLRDTPQDTLLNFLKLRNKMDSMTASYSGDFAIYFEYIPTGVSIGINPNSDFQAASLLKLPVTMAYYRGQEDSGKFSNPVLTLTREMIDDGFGDLWKKGEGYQISAEDAVKLALQKSDNTAVKALLSQIDEKSFDEVYNGLDISSRVYQEYPILNARQYASILKALYFSSLLSFNNSEKILEILTHSEYNDKLPAGVPKDVTIAHKIGVFEDKLYSDCGIIYVPRRPYVLCMVSKSDERIARERMKTISKTIYDYVSDAKDSK
jgi:beta-lactamase class A